MTGPARPGYDAVVVGARCAGSPLAARLAAAGWSVLLVDPAPPPADTLSTHFLYPNTVARLAELGALERIEAEHRLNPAIYAARFLGHEVVGDFTPVGGFDRMYAVTRPVLDSALLDVALAAGAETRLGRRVTGLLGGGDDADPVRGVVLDDGETVAARWVVGADGRASTVARLLGLAKREPLAGGMGFLFSYWSGLPASDRFQLEVLESETLTVCPCEDDLSIVLLGVVPEDTRGDAAGRQRRFRAGVDRFAEWFDPDALRRGEQRSPVRVAPESMLRGFFRDAAGPGWGLVGDAGHFKHPNTAQGISDAIEQALEVADRLIAHDSLDGYGAWRDERAREHYEWSFQFGRLPDPAVAGPIFAGLAADPAAAQDFRDSFSRLKRPRSDVMRDDRLAAWFGAGAAG
ncbi:MAG: FAD-dependent monooxygenase [Solirubrobacterales bacterium]|nr:FAD-dependent monooxygenase [Solirubrobacterales bacterium]